MSGSDRVAYLTWLEFKLKFQPLLIKAMTTAAELSKSDEHTNTAEHKRVKDVVKVTLERNNKVAAEYSIAHNGNNERKTKVDAWRRRITE